MLASAARRRCRQIARAAPVEPPPPPVLPAVDPLCTLLQARGRPGSRHACCARRRHPSCASATAACSPPAAPPSSRATSRCCERIGAALKGGAGAGAGDRLHRQPADPHRAVPVQLSALRGARARRRRRSSRSAIGDPGRIAAEGRGEADPLDSQRHAERRASKTGGSRSCCIARGKPGDARVLASSSRAGSLSLRRHRPARRSRLVLRPVPAAARRLGRAARAIVVAMLALWAGVNLCSTSAGARRDAALAKGVAEAAADPTVAASAEEAAALREKLGDRARAAAARRAAPAAISTSSRGTRSSARPAPARRRRC